MAHGAQVVDVLPTKEYEQFHLPGAVHVPLKHLPERAKEVLDPRRPVVTYCWDSRCDLSARAAHRLEMLGFAEVYDYVASKVDWTANGLPVEGAEVRVTHLADLVQPEGPQGETVVVNDANVVVGLRRPDGTVEEGPSTYRPDVTVEEMAGHLAKHPAPRVLVTNADGTFVGFADPGEIERAARTAR